MSSATDGDDAAITSFTRDIVIFCGDSTDASRYFTGIELIRDDCSRSVSNQHPCEDGSGQEQVTFWLDRRPRVRPSVVQIWADDGELVGSGDAPQPWSRQL